MGVGRELWITVFIAMLAVAIGVAFPPAGAPIQDALGPSESSDELKQSTKVSTDLELIKDAGVAQESSNRRFTDSVPRAQILVASWKIDELAAELANSSASENDLVSDEVFVRRVFLDIAGRIPTFAEFSNFMSSTSSEKRFDLIDELLDSEAYVSRQFNYFADLLRFQSRTRVGPNKSYSDFITNSIRNNRPYDEFVRELLCASGPNMKRGNGATGYLLRDFGMPEVTMSTTIRIFLGTRLECAQCHDHPYDNWTRRQYYEMVAFFGGIDYWVRNPESRYYDEMKDLMNDPNFSADQRRFTRQALLPLIYGIDGSGTGMARLPEDYQYEDGEAYEYVSARTIYGDVQASPKSNIKARGPDEYSMIPEHALLKIRGAKPIYSRETLAHWLTASSNDRFSTVIANRLWKQAMGLGVVEPIDDITDENYEQRPELLRYLSQLMVSLDYDVKQLLRAIYYSEAYQRKSTAIPDEYVGQNVTPRFRRMSAEQIWDSLLTLTIDDVDRPRFALDPIPNYLGKLDVYSSYDKLVQLEPSDVQAIVEKTMRSREVTQDYPRHVFRMDARPGVNRRHLVFDELTGNELVRASGLLSPMPANHLLRDFGQSDREAVDNFTNEISISQLLELINGYVEQRISGDEDSVLMRQLRMAPDNTRRIEIAYQSILGRLPSHEEKIQWERDYEEYGSEITSDLAWTLVNSTEFLFIK